MVLAVMEEIALMSEVVKVFSASGGSGGDSINAGGYG